ncbi:hypothetical protein OEZ85_009990 [Tetradesmus obliquus]|uniref:J domain-containing protein n=1 Tax=Tetradesmus obliquus TaxID=3088 RepID=A0ABY8UAQ8_TETOB|nr:hypothetical protein OEZ85_009990 [Tetradesmus obliquus]
MATPYHVLGLEPNAPKDQVKEAFRKLVWQYHPDKAAPNARVTAEAKFKEVKLAYEAILQHEAGYRPPPPGSAPNAHHAEAYWHAHSADGRVPWGQYAGHETEWGFYRAMMRSGRNNLALLSMMGLLAIPSIAAGVAILQSILTDKREEEEERAPENWRPDSFVVNGQVTSHNPWAANTQVVDINRYKEAQARLRAKREVEAKREAEAADGSR